MNKLIQEFKDYSHYKMIWREKEDLDVISLYGETYYTAGYLVFPENSSITLLAMLTFLPLSPVLNSFSWNCFNIYRYQLAFFVRSLHHPS